MLMQANSRGAVHTAPLIMPFTNGSASPSGFGFTMYCFCLQEMLWEEFVPRDGGEPRKMFQCPSGLCPIKGVDEDIQTHIERYVNEGKTCLKVHGCSSCSMPMLRLGKRQRTGIATPYFMCEFKCQTPPIPADDVFCKETEGINLVMPDEPRKLIKALIGAGGYFKILFDKSQKSLYSTKEALLDELIGEPAPAVVDAPAPPKKKAAAAASTSRSGIVTKKSTTPRKATATRSPAATAAALRRLGTVAPPSSVTGDDEESGDEAMVIESGIEEGGDE
jgi:hypothetical protein